MRNSGTLEQGRRRRGSRISQIGSPRPSARRLPDFFARIFVGDDQLAPRPHGRTPHFRSDSPPSGSRLLVLPNSLSRPR